MYDRGNGVPQDDKAAMKWYKLAAEQGVSRAQKRLQELQKQITNRKPPPIVMAKKTLEPFNETQEELDRLHKEIAQLIKEEKKRPKPLPAPKAGAPGIGYLVSKSGDVITNKHIVSKCKKVTVGGNAQKQVATDIIEMDIENDLALLKVSPLKMKLVEAKSFIQQLGVKIIPFASRGRLRSEDLGLKEDLLASGYPYGEIFGDNINLNLGIEASKVRQFLSNSGLLTNQKKQSKRISTRDLTKLAKRQSLMVICYQ
jgi:S1-C subfamily serine protease